MRVWKLLSNSRWNNPSGSKKGTLISHFINLSLIISRIELQLVQPTRLLFASLTAFAISSGTEAYSGQQILTSLLGNGFEPQNLGFLESAFEQLVPAISSTNSGTRKSAAQCFGILYSGLIASRSESEYNRVSNALDALAGKSLPGVISGWIADNSTSNQAWGGFLALSHALCRLSNDGDMSQLSATLFPLSDFIISLLKRFEQESNSEGLDAAAECVGLLGSWGVFGKVVKFPISKVLADGKPFEVMNIVSKLKKSANDGNETAILNLGRLSVWMDEETDSAVLESISEIVRQCHELKQTAAQFTVGKALSYLAFCNVGDSTLSNIH